MRADPGRTKKLIVAFHFYRSNPAGWKCDECRRQGLERRRRCGWIAQSDAPPAVVWTRRGISTTQCPVSLITAGSLTLLEEYSAHKVLSARPGLYGLAARTVDAFVVLESELEAERRKEQGHGNE